MKPSGSIRCSGVSVATQSRPIEPVFCGISGATRTTCTVEVMSAERHAARADRQLEPIARAGDGEAHELVVGGPEEARAMTAALHATVEDVVAADGEGRRIERLAALVVQHDGEAGGRIA